MKKYLVPLVILCLMLPVFSQDKKSSVNLEDLTWIEAEKALKNYEVVMISLGARTKEHGPHLLLKNDYVMAEELKKQVMQQVPVAVLPTLQYGYYPSFLEYPGSVSLSAETFKNIVVDICLSMKTYGINKFYVLNTGVSTTPPLQKAREELQQKGIELRYLNILEVDNNLPEGLMKQEGGTHADEGETSMMLHLAPHIVDMTKAVKDYDARPNRRGLTRDPEGSGHYSPTGIWGDPTLATKEKGKIIVDATIQEIVKQIKDLIAFER
jgi:creatinine amidohydrolase